MLWCERSTPPFHVGLLCPGSLRQMVGLGGRSCLPSGSAWADDLLVAAAVPAQLMGLQDQAMLSLGDWQDKGKEKQSSAKIGLRYSAARYALSLRTKHKVFAVAHALQSFEAWEVIPPEAVEAVLQEAEKAVGAAVSQDGTALWTAPTEKADIQKLVMLRKRALLCALWQSGSCTQSEEECGRRHQCAILLRTGRVCGGNHTECRAKRWVSAEAVEAPPVLLRPAIKAMPRSGESAPSSSTSRPSPPPTLPTMRPAEPAGPPPKRRKVAAAVAEQPEPVGERDREFDRLAAGKGRSAEAPTWIFESEAGGKVWLSGLPLRTTDRALPGRARFLRKAGPSLRRRPGWGQTK